LNSKYFKHFDEFKNTIKVSGQFRNKEGKGAERYAKIHSVVDTTIKNGQDVYDAFLALAMGKIGGS